LIMGGGGGGSMMGGGGKGGGGGGGGGSQTQGGAMPFDMSSIMSQLDSAKSGGMGMSTAGTSQDYATLGLASTGGADPAEAAASGKSLQGTGPGTAEQMDTGQMPSVSGGIQAQNQAGQGGNTNLGSLAQSAGFGAGYSGA
jgi:hypothetical protein